MVETNKISESSVFLVSGGAKGITAKCVIALARHFPCRWILLGRSELSDCQPPWANIVGGEEGQIKKAIIAEMQSRGEKPSPMGVQKVYKKWRSQQEILQTLYELRELGRMVEYVSADVTNSVLLREKVVPAISRLGTVTGIIHGAGNLADKLIEKKTLQDFETVYAPKIKGLENLLQCADLQELKYLILFSSVAGFYGNAGQADYALANEILNRSAHWVKQKYPQCQAIAINWGPWDMGMVTPQLKKIFSQYDVQVLPVESATQMLLRELDGRSKPETQVIIGDPLPPARSALSESLQTHRIRRNLRLEDNPFLQDHVIGGYPVLPFTCAIAWMATSCEQLYPGYQFVVCNNLKVLKGIIFDSNVASDYVLEAREIAKDSQKIVLETKILSLTRESKIRYHFSGIVELQSQPLEGKNYDSFDLDEDRKIAKTRPDFYQQGGDTLFHGSLFQGVDRVLNITPQKITTRVTVGDIEAERQGQFQVHPCNPYIADVMSHGIWIFSQHFYHSACLPSKIDKFEQFRLPPFDKPCYVTGVLRSKTSSAVKFDMFAHDENGKIYTISTGAEATLFPANYMNDGDRANGNGNGKTDLIQV